MAGIQISGLVANSAFDWKSVVDQLIAADSIPMNDLNTQKTTNSGKITALASLQSSLLDLQTSLQNLRGGDLFTARTVTTDTANTTWKSNSSNGAALGTYEFNVTQLASQAQITGAPKLSVPLSTTADVTGLTLASLKAANPITAGTFTVNGAQVTIATTDSLQDVFDKIAAATGNTVTGGYDAATDRISLTSTGGPVVLNATNDTSNFVAVMKLANNGTTAVTSTAPLGALQTGATIANAGLKTALTGLDGSGNGAFKLNGVVINYNANTDTVSTLISRINQSTAGVTATYDSANDRVNLVNNNTGDIGIGLGDVSGNLLAALGLTPAGGGSFVRGNNAQFTINGGPVINSTSNTLDSTVTGISGLSVTVNTKSDQTLQVESDTASMQSALQDFIDKFNAVQTFITTNTKITSTGTTVTTSVLSDNREVQDWGSQLQSLAFAAIPAISGSIQSLDALGIGFTGTDGQLSITNSTALANALAEKPNDVQNFFLSGTTGFVSKLYGYLTNIVSADSGQQSDLTKANSDLDTQIATMQSKLDDERTTLTNSFIAMLDAQSKAQSQNQTLTNAFFSNNKNSS